MAENNKPKFDLPWGTLLPLLAVLAGVIATYKPLVSERPSVPSEKTAPVIAAQDVDARLWQDPIGVAQKQKSLLNQQGDPQAKEASAKLHDISALAALLDQDVKAFPEDCASCPFACGDARCRAVQRTSRVAVARAPRCARRIERERIYADRW